MRAVYNRLPDWNYKALSSICGIVTEMMNDRGFLIDVDW